MHKILYLYNLFECREGLAPGLACCDEEEQHEGVVEGPEVGRRRPPVVGHPHDGVCPRGASARARTSRAGGARGPVPVRAAAVCRRPCGPIGSDRAG